MDAFERTFNDFTTALHAGACRCQAYQQPCRRYNARLGSGGWTSSYQSQQTTQSHRKKTRAATSTAKGCWGLLQLLLRLLLLPLPRPPALQTQVSRLVWMLACRLWNYTGVGGLPVDQMSSQWVLCTSLATQGPEDGQCRKSMWQMSKLHLLFHASTYSCRTCSSHGAHTQRKRC
jgi:hypothetical protein